jgi:drug/metabolite transporter (DMT)-like permease
MRWLSSILFGMVLAGVVLRETISRPRMAAGVGIVAGVVALKLSI